MKQTDTGEKKPIVLPCIAGLICILEFYLIGVIVPAFVDIFRACNIYPIGFRFLPYIHWFWTVPLGCLIAGSLIWGSRHWSRKANLKIDLIAIWLAIFLFLTFIFHHICSNAWLIADRDKREDCGTKSIGVKEEIKGTGYFFQIK